MAPEELQDAESLAEKALAQLIEDDQRRKICGGEVLFRIRLAANEVATLEPPRPLFVVARRVAYLPCFFSDIVAHFGAAVAPCMGQPQEIWLDYQLEPLNWQLPIGVSLDLLVGATVPAPVDLTCHFHGRPSKVPSFGGLSDLQRIVMNAFRQAIFLLQGSTAPFGKLPRQRQTLLWDAISNSNLDAFFQVQSELLSNCSTLGKCRSLAIRLHFCGPACESYQLLRPVEPLSSNLEALTLGSLLKEAMPPLFAASGQLIKGVIVLTHGLKIPLETPLFWLALHATYCDQFVHIIVHAPKALMT